MHRCYNHVPTLALDEAVWAYIVALLEDPATTLAHLPTASAEARASLDQARREQEQVAGLEARYQRALDRLQADYYLRMDDKVFLEQYARLYPSLLADYEAARQRRQQMDQRLLEMAGAHACASA